MPSDHGELSRIALEAELDVDELRARLARMNDRALLEFGRRRPICARRTRIWHPPRKQFVLQLEAAGAE
jgi:hypothetical protein